MPSRRSLRLVAGALVLTAPLLTSCGFSKATDRPYTPGEGTNDRSGDVKVLSAVIVAAQPNSGTFLATFSNNSSKEATLDSIEGAGDPAVTVGGELPGGELPPRGYVNLADTGGPTVTGEFDAGRMIPLTITFGSGESVTLDVPVVFACDEYTGLDPSVAEEEDASASPSTDPTASPSASESAAPEPGERYDCAAVLDDEGAATDVPSESASAEGSEAAEPSASPTEAPSESATP